MARRVDPFTKQAFGPQTLVGQQPIMARMVPKGSRRSAPGPLGAGIPDEVTDRATPQLMAGYGQFNFKAANCTVYSWGDTQYGACWTDAEEGGNSAGYAAFPDSTGYFNRPEEMHTSACIWELQPASWMATSYAIDCEGYLWMSGTDADAFLSNDPLGDGGIYGYADGPDNHPLFTEGPTEETPLGAMGRRGPLRFGGFGKVTAAAGTYQGILYRKEDGSWWGVGDNSNFIPSTAGGGAGGLDERECDLMPSGVDIERVYINEDTLGSDTFFALSADGDLYSWGNVFSNSVLGRFPGYDYVPTDEEFATPGLMDLPAPVVKTSGGYEFQIALLDNGDLYGWGEAYDINNFRGGHFGMDAETAYPLAQATGDAPGNEGAPEFFSPVALPIDNVADFACRRGGTVVVKTDGTVWTTGYNENWGGAGLDPPDMAGQFSSLGYINSEIAGDMKFQYEFKQVTDPEMTSRNALLVCCASSNDDATVVYCDDGSLISFGSDFEVQLARGETPPSLNHSYYGPGLVKLEREKLEWSAQSVIAGGKSTIANTAAMMGTPLGQAAPLGAVPGDADFPQLSMSWYAGMVRRGDGKVFCWGWNNWNETGLNAGSSTDPDQIHTFDPAPFPTENTPLEDAVWIDQGLANGLAGMPDGTVLAWGTEFGGVLGYEISPEGGYAPPQVVPGISDTISGNIGPSLAVALKDDGTVWEWGQGSQYVGAGAEWVPVQVPGISGVVKVLTADNVSSHTVVLKDDGTVWGWGSNLYYYVGVVEDIATPVQLFSEIPDIVDVDMNDSAALIVTGSGEMYGLGYGGSGELNQDPDSLPGLPGDPQPFTTEPVLMDTGVAAIGSGGTASYWIGVDGQLYASGSNTDGEQGNGEECLTGTSPSETGDWGNCRYAKHAVLGMSDVVDIAAGGQTHLALKSDCSVWIWGRTDAYQIPGHNARLDDRSSPVTVPIQLMESQDLLAWSADLALAGGKSSLGRLGLNGGQAYVWGLNDYGELLLPNTDLNDPLPSPDFDAYTQWAIGDGHTMLLKGDGTVECVGRNSSGQLGDGTTTDSDTPVAVSGLSGVVEIAAGYAHSMARKSDGTVWCWGNDGLGQIGNGPGSSADTTVPNQVEEVTSNGGVTYSDLTGITKIWAGPNSSYAKGADGTLYAWGRITPHLSDTSAEPQISIKENAVALTLTLVPGPISDLAAGEGTVMYLMTDGTVKVASFNEFGEMGRGDDDVNPTGQGYAEPVTVPDLASVSAIACGANHCLALLSSGTVWAWGFGDDGEIGDDSCASRFSPSQVAGLTGITQIAAGQYHSLALKDDGSIWAWGKNADGQLGDDTYTNRCAPVQVFILGDSVDFDANPGGTCGAGGGGGDGEVPPDTELPPVSLPPAISFPVPDISLDTGIDAPPDIDIGFPDPGDFPMPPIGFPGPGMPDIDFPDFPDFGKPPWDDISFPDPPFDMCSLPGMGGCGPGPGTGSGAPGGRKPDGKHPPGHGGGGGGGNTGKKDTFGKRRCYTNADVVATIIKLFKELGLDDDMLEIPIDCDKTFTKCFAKGSRKWDAIWYLSDLCGAQPIEPIPGDPIIIVPVVPNNVVHTIHAYALEGTYPLFSLERDADDAQNYFAVEVYRLAVSRNGRVIIPEVSKVAIVPGSFTADPSSWLRIEIRDPNISEAEMEQRAITEAQKAGRMTYRCTATTTYAPDINLLDQVRIINPWRGLDQILMVTEKAYDISESGRFTVITARHHPDIVQPGVNHVTYSAMEIGDNPPIQPY